MADVNTAAEAAIDPYDPRALAVSHTLGGGDIEADRKLSSIQCRKPHKTEWIFVHPGDEGVARNVALLKMEESQGGDELYLVLPSMQPHIGDDCFLADIYLCVDRQGNPFLWAVRQPDADNPNKWHLSCQRVAREGQKQWIKVKANQKMQHYDFFTLKESMVQTDPIWPQETMAQLLRLAFEEVTIDSPEHVIVKKLTGNDA